MEFDFKGTIEETIEKISMKATEETENFIFEIIKPYCENVLQIKINKEELKQIIIRGTQKPQPCSDCVSRTDALNAFKPEGISEELWMESNTYKVLAKLPSVQPQKDMSYELWKESYEELQKRMDRLTLCNDAVSREAVQDLIARLLSDYLYDEDREKIEIINAEIGELPSIQPNTQERDNSVLERVEDCVSREAVIENVIKCTDMNVDTMEVLEDKVRALPSVNPQRKRGKWKYVTHYGERYRVCSECGCEKEDDRATGWCFCQYCGADMRGDTDDSK